MRDWSTPGEKPWFQLGSVPVTTSTLIALVIGTSMFFIAAEGELQPTSRYLYFDTDHVLHGQLWRLVTWWIPNPPSLWAVIDAAIIWYMGNQLEGALGRDRMVRFIAYLTIVPPLVLILLDLSFIPGSASFLGTASLLSLALILSFITYMPGARFFFGIPGWILAVVMVGVNVLGLLGDRAWHSLFFLLSVVGVALLAARAFGLADSVEWIPRLPLPGGEPGPVHQPRRRRRRQRPATVTEINPIQSQLEEMEIDAILDQVASEGLDSLSRAQRKKLEDQAKKRRRDR
ncbi:MAG: hypothetical protein GY745_12165 [Actinomycetia bacterium]|nr:hypothetical protein [Actinomycetes bacterium]